MSLIKSLLFLLFFTGFVFTQKTFEFTEQEVVDLFNSITELEYADSINNQMIVNLKQQIQLYETQITNNDIIISEQELQLKLKDDLIKEIKPKWYEHRYLWYGYGVLSIFIPIQLISQIN